MTEWRPADIDFVTWDLRMSEWPRSRKRALINGLMNGLPPYSEKEVQDNGITINVNDLGGPREAHNARAQISAAFMKPGAYFTCTTDCGTRHKRSGYGRTVTGNLAKVMKRSLPYFETHRSKWAPFSLMYCNNAPLLEPISSTLSACGCLSFMHAHSSLKCSSIVAEPLVMYA